MKFSRGALNVSREVLARRVEITLTTIWSTAFNLRRLEQFVSRHGKRWPLIVSFLLHTVSVKKVTSFLEGCAGTKRENPIRKTKNRSSSFSLSTPLGKKAATQSTTESTQSTTESVLKKEASWPGVTPASSTSLQAPYQVRSVRCDEHRCAV